MLSTLRSLAKAFLGRTEKPNRPYTATRIALDAEFNSPGLAPEVSREELSEIDFDELVRTDELLRTHDFERFCRLIVDEVDTAEWRADLGLPPGPLTRDQILRGFRAAVLHAHPDHGGDAGAFKRAIVARDRLLALLRARTEGRPD